MNTITWILAGALLGASASALIGTRDRTGLALNVATGIAGVLSGGWLLGVLVDSTMFGAGVFSLAGLLVSLMGATVLLIALQMIRGGIRDRVDGIAQSGTNYQSETTEMDDRSAVGHALRPLMAAGVAGILMLVGACASAPLAPESALDGAKVAISNADKAGAGQYANAELAEARARLTLADNAVKDEDMVAAERFARESQVQAELASARTEAAKAAAVNRDMERGTEAMTEEMQRAGEPR